MRAEYKGIGCVINKDQYESYLKFGGTCLLEITFNTDVSSIELHSVYNTTN